jgi:hypothetical protein
MPGGLARALGDEGCERSAVACPRNFTRRGRALEAASELGRRCSVLAAHL